MNKREMQRQIQVELPPDIAEGVYANLALITHSPSEFVIDFARMVPGAPKAKVESRIIMTPMNTKMLLKALGDNIGKFEAKFGEIKMPEGQSGMKGAIGFNDISE